ncbi:HAD family hydrolase, partial [Luminiphilus sp.]|nr:HAD family hydrolase [Luminiphilus sp.]
MTASVRLITFDLDDTLWDVKPALVAADAAQWRYLTARFPKEPLRELADQQAGTLRAEILAEKPMLAHYISQFREAFIYRLLLRSGQSKTTATEAASEAFAAFYAERHKVALFEDAATALSTLSQDYLLGALTNGNADVRKTPIASYFSYAWRAEEFGISKPDILLFHRVFEQAGVAANEVIH